MFIIIIIILYFTILLTGFLLGALWLAYKHDGVETALWIFNITCILGSAVLSYKYYEYKPAFWFPYLDKITNLGLARCATFLYSWLFYLWGFYEVIVILWIIYLIYDFYVDIKK